MEDISAGTPCTYNRGDGLGQVVLSRLRIEKREKCYNIIRERKNSKVGSIAVLGCDNDPRRLAFKGTNEIRRQVFFIVVLRAGFSFCFPGKRDRLRFVKVSSRPTNSAQESYVGSSDSRFDTNLTLQLSSIRSQLPLFPATSL